MENITINGASYFVKIHKHSLSLPYMLMLHGFMGDHRVFDHLIPKLSGMCNPVMVDLLGHGQSEKKMNPSRYHEEQQVADLLELIQARNLSPLFIYGYSMGGRLALKTALQAPRSVEGLILESSNFGIEDENERAERRQIDQQRADDIVKDFRSFQKKWAGLPLFQSPSAAHTGLKQKYNAIQQSQVPRAMAASITGFSTGGMRPVKNRLPDFPKPTLLLVGSNDEKYVEINDTMAQLFVDAQLKKLKAGHRVHLDNPALLAAAIKDFLSDQVSGYHTTRPD